MEISIVDEAQRLTRCSLLVEIHSLLVTCYKITRYSLQNLLVTHCKIRSLLVAEVAFCINHSLLVAKYARYALQKLLVVKIHSLIVAKFARCL